MGDYKFIIDYDDIRFSWLFSDLLQNGYSVSILGNNKPTNNKQIIYILSPKRQINTDFLDTLQKESIVFAYNCPKSTINKFKKKGTQIYLYSNDPTFMYANAKLTAQGTIPYIITNTDMSLEDCIILILGGGRIATSLALYLNNIGANTTLATNIKDEQALLSLTTHNICNINKAIKEIINYDIIINTIPSPVIPNIAFQSLKKDITILDLATNSGIDKKQTSSANIKLLNLNGLPSITAPKTAAKIIKQSVLQTLNLSQ